MVLGLMSLVWPGKGTPSSMISGVVLAVMELRPLTCWLAELPGTVRGLGQGVARHGSLQCLEHICHGDL